MSKTKFPGTGIKHFDGLIADLTTLRQACHILLLIKGARCMKKTNKSGILTQVQGIILF